MWRKDQVVSKMQKSGKRITKQRLIILDVILENKWSSCKEVYYEAAHRDSSIGMSTVYRTMSVLEEMGVLKRGYQYSAFIQDEALAG